MAVAPSAMGETLRERDELRLISCVRVSNAVAHFAQSLPFRVRCSSDLDRGLAWAPRKVALRHGELAPDPPGWKTALRFDVDLSLIHISEPTRLGMISYAVFCLKKK